MKQLQSLLLLFALVTLVASCTPVMQPPLKALDSGSSVTSGGKYVPKVDNFEVILDSSLTMEKSFVGARDIVSRINQGIPSDLSYNGGLRSLGHSRSQSKNPTDLLYGMTAYNKADFHDGLGKIKYVGGSTPMAAALSAAGNDLKSASGKSALILVSDGLHMYDAPAAAENLKGMMGNNLCIYTISIGSGNNGAGQEMMQQLADIGQCGFATTDTDLADNASMANFINSVFLGKAAPVVVKPKPAPVPLLDSDGDGVTDDLDRCPNTPKGAPVDKVGCPLDSDGDGVFDYFDQCPGTPAGVSVDVYGCPTKLTLHINFGHDSSKVGAEFDSEVAKAAQCINDYPGNSVFIDGHTDSSGSAAYNQKLSEQRAAAVKNRLIERFNVKESRMVSRGFGEDQPVASNKTAASRSLNRRVEVACGATN
ncbi:MAG: OmpA family protein [Thermodesulfobacteriota bacterium]|nr:OmpA family protein [Thermodesulfobacteriota bacterium]